MNPTVKNIIAVVAGIIIGSMVNMGLIMISSKFIPLPPGVDPADMESLKANIASFPPKNFIFPFLAHAFGTLLGAFVVTKVAAKNHFRLAMVIGLFFLLGGILMVMDLPSPMWFNVLDLVGAYIPMAYFGWKMARRKK
jgi:uncharacterized membrane protein YqgA involved in biofilm formation